MGISKHHRLKESFLDPVLAVQDLADTTNGHIHNSIRALIPKRLPIQHFLRCLNTIISTPPPTRRGPLLRRLTTTHTLLTNLPITAPNNLPRGVNNRNMPRLINKTLNLLHPQRQVAGIIPRQRNVDIHNQHDQPRRYGQTPPSVRVVVYTQLM